jgi:hypothetical protein
VIVRQASGWTLTTDREAIDALHFEDSYVSATELLGTLAPRSPVLTSCTADERIARTPPLSAHG